MLLAVFYLQNKVDRVKDELQVNKPDTSLNVPSKTTITGDSVSYSTKRGPPSLVKKVFKGVEDRVSSILGSKNIDEDYIPSEVDTVIEYHTQKGITEFKDDHSFGKFGKISLSGSVRWPEGQTTLVYKFTPPDKKWRFQPLIGIIENPFVGVEIGKQGTFSVAPLYDLTTQNFGFYLKLNF